MGAGSIITDFLTHESDFTNGYLNYYDYFSDSEKLTD